MTLILAQFEAPPLFLNRFILLLSFQSTTNVKHLGQLFVFKENVHLTCCLQLQLIIGPLSWNRLENEKDPARVSKEHGSYLHSPQTGAWDI